MDCSPPGSSVHGIPRTWTRILEWVAISFYKRSSQPRDQTWASSVSWTDKWILYHRATWVGFFTTEPSGKPPDLLGHWLQTRGWISLNFSAPTFHGCGFYFATKLNSLHIYSFFRSTCSTTGYNFKDQRNTTNSITLNPTSQNTDSATLDDQKLPKDHRIKETKSVYSSGQCRFTFDWRKTQIYFKQLTLLNFFTLRITIISPISVIF